jgi:hypothetical protein
VLYLVGIGLTTAGLYVIATLIEVARRRTLVMAAVEVHVLRLGAFAILGAALVTGTTVRRLGWYAVGHSLAMIELFAVLSDPPLVLFYLVTLPIGVWLLRQARRAMAAARPPP